MLYDFLLAPFVDFGFMRRALVASLALASGGSAIGVFLILQGLQEKGEVPVLGNAELKVRAVAVYYISKILGAKGYLA